jgi:hypothetical protein
MSNRTKRRALKQRLTRLRLEQSRADRVIERALQWETKQSPLRALFEAREELLRIATDILDRSYLTKRNAKEWACRSTPHRLSLPHITELD